MATWLTAAALLAASQPAQADVDALFAHWGAQTPGCTVAVARDGRTVLDRAYGMADLEHGIANTPATRFEAGSVSKQFTAAAILMLAEQGRLSLADDVRRFVPELPDYGARITIDQLLNHTSGLRDWGSVAALAGWPRGEAAYTQADAVAIIARQRSLNYAPGDEYSYTNSGYNLLTLIVERAGGVTLADFTRARLFEPLGMTATQWRDDFRRIVPNRAIAYARSGEGFAQAMPFEDAYGNGGLITTTGDLAIWNAALMASRLGPFVTAELERLGMLSDGRAITYARGLFIDRHRGLREISHGGATGGYRAWLGFYPEVRLSVAMLCNAANADRDVARAVADLYLPEAAPAPGDARLADIDGRAGLFVDERTGMPMRLIIEAGALRAAGGALLRAIGADRAEGPGGILHFEGRDHFRLLRPEGDSTVYRRAAPWTPSAAMLTALAGDYVSDEAGAGYRIEIREGEAWMIHAARPGLRHALRPLYADAFAFDGGIVRVHRDADGEIAAIGLGAARVRDLRFERASP